MTKFEEFAAACEARETHEWDNEKHHVCRWNYLLVKDCNRENCPRWPEEAE